MKPWQRTSSIYPLNQAATTWSSRIAALHHALDLPRTLAEMSRVCRVGGVVAGLNEGVRDGATADTDVQAAEKTYGINEHVYTLTDYFGSILAQWAARQLF